MAEKAHLRGALPPLVPCCFGPLRDHFPLGLSNGSQDMGGQPISHRHLAVVKDKKRRPGKLAGLLPQDELVRRGEIAITELERRGDDVHGKTVAQI